MANHSKGKNISHSSSPKGLLAPKLATWVSPRIFHNERLRTKYSMHFSRVQFKCMSMPYLNKNKTHLVQLY